MFTSRIQISIVLVLEYFINSTILSNFVEASIGQESPSQRQSRNGYRPITCSGNPANSLITTKNSANIRLVCMTLGEYRVADMPTFGVDDFDTDDVPHHDVAEIFMSVSETDDTWMLNDHKMFHSFQNLIHLELGISPRISSQYDESSRRTELLNELFNLPNLKSIRLRNWNHGDTFVWKFPKNIEQLVLHRCNYTHFDLSPYPNLSFVDFSFSRLKKLPQFSSPPPPLQTLWLHGMRSLDFSVMEITHLCSLNDLRVFEYDNDGSNYDTKRYCECRRAGQYAVEFGFLRKELICSIQTRGTCSKSCTDYPFEEAAKKRAQLCKGSSNPSTLTNLADFPIFPPQLASSQIYLTSQFFENSMGSCSKGGCDVFVFIGGFFLLTMFAINVPLCIIIRRKRSIAS